MTTGEIRQVTFLLIGAGNVGRRFLNLVDSKRTTLRERLGLDLVLVGVADRSGAARNPDGLSIPEIMALKKAGQGVAEHPRWGMPAETGLEMVKAGGAELLVEASPANMVDGQPAMSCIVAALSGGMHVVTANKAPLVLAFPRLAELARARGLQLRYDATVTGGLPAVNIGQRDLAASDIYRLEGVLNLTTNYILTRMAQDGLSYEEALAHAQAAGHAETDPTLDVEGWDATNKLVILANSVLGFPAKLDDVAVTGITGVGEDALRAAAAEGKRIKLVATAEADGDRYRLSVRPTPLPADHPLAQLGPKQMGIVFHTDINGSISATIVEDTPTPTAAAVLRDVVEIYAGAGRI
ncbi:MAG: homoserine dehydrogenase [Anaerolineae bacterium]|jgi:homoserine dehydrogenase